MPADPAGVTIGRSNRSWLRRLSSVKRLSELTGPHRNEPHHAPESTIMIPVPRLRPRDGWKLLSGGFRPFFLLGSIYAGLAILVWLPVFTGELTLTTTFAPRDWHVHEMLYGYLPA